MHKIPTLKSRDHITLPRVLVRSQNRPVIYSLLFHALKIDSMCLKIALSVETLT